MLKRILPTLTALTLALTLALGAIAATPEGASAANGGRVCVTEGQVEACSNGGRGEGGAGGRTEYEFGGEVGYTDSGGSGKGGGGRFCITRAGQTDECTAGQR